MYVGYIRLLNLLCRARWMATWSYVGVVEGLYIEAVGLFEGLSKPM